MQTVVAWAVFGLFVWVVLGVRGTVRSPLALVAHHQENTSADTGSDRDGVATPSGTGPAPADTATEPQMAGDDTRHGWWRHGWLDSVVDACDVVFRRPQAPGAPMSGVGDAPPPTAESQTVTEPRVVVSYVMPGVETGTLAAVDDDGSPVVVRLETLPVPRPPAAPVERHDPVPPLRSWLDTAHDLKEPDPPPRVAEVTARRDWLRAMDANESFTRGEVDDMYAAKFGKSERTLQRDRDTNQKEHP